MWGLIDSSKRDYANFEATSPIFGRRNEELQVYDCELPSSVYQRCYPVTITRKASLCSIGTLDGTDHPNGYYSSGFQTNTNVFGFPNNNNNHVFGFSNNNNNEHVEGFPNSNNKHVFTFEGEEAHGHSNQWDDSRRDSIKEEEEEERNVDLLEDAAVSCCYEEECSFGLHDLLTEKLEKQITPLLHSVFASSSTTSLAFVGLSTTLASAVVDILRLSEEEPYGIRGASIILKFRSDSNLMNGKKGNANDDKTLGIIAMDHATVSTFELTLVLCEERHLGLAIKNWLKATLARGSAQQAHVISPKYFIEKKKLYR